MKTSCKRTEKKRCTLQEEVKVVYRSHSSINDSAGLGITIRIRIFGLSGVETRVVAFTLQRLGENH